jgi:hypothetical protein
MLAAIVIGMFKCRVSLSGESERVIIFRGWPVDADRVTRNLLAAGVPCDQVDAVVPFILGGSLLVSEVFVDIANARRAADIARSIDRRTPLGGCS